MPIKEIPAILDLAPFPLHLIDRQLIKESTCATARIEDGALQWKVPDDEAPSGLTPTFGTLSFAPR